MDKEKVNKMVLPATILIASVILGGFYYASQISTTSRLEKCLGDEGKLYGSKTRTYDEQVDLCFKMYK